MSDTCLGPMQLLVIDFRSAVLPPIVHAQIEDLHQRGLMRLVDSVVATKEDNGRLIALDTLDAPRGIPVWKGVLAQSLFGANGSVGWKRAAVMSHECLLRPSPELSVTEEQLLEIADLIPTRARVLFLLLEQLWTSEFDMAAAEAHGRLLATCWFAPRLLSQPLEQERPLLG